MLRRDWERHADSPFASIFVARRGGEAECDTGIDFNAPATAFLRAVFLNFKIWPADERDELRDCIARLLPLVQMQQQQQQRAGDTDGGKALAVALAVPSMCSTLFVEMLRRDEYKAILVIGLYYSLLKTVLDSVPGCWWAMKRTDLLLKAVTAVFGSEHLDRCIALLRQSI
jgi:hypothetical protein